MVVDAAKLNQSAWAFSLGSYAKGKKGQSPFVHLHPYILKQYDIHYKDDILIYCRLHIEMGRHFKTSKPFEELKITPYPPSVLESKERPEDRPRLVAAVHQVAGLHQNRWATGPFSWHGGTGMAWLTHSERSLLGDIFWTCTTIVFRIRVK